MKKTMFALLAVAGTTASASAAEILLVDLSVPNQIGISATAGTSAVTASGSNFTGFLLNGFYNGGTSTVNTSTGGVGNFTTFNNPADNNPGIFRATNDPGLNFWSFSTSTTVSFTAGVQAFTGSATWALTPAQYADMVAGNLTGDIIFPADTTGDPGVVIGQWRVIPTPGAMAMLGMGGLLAARRRR